MSLLAPQHKIALADGHVIHNRTKPRRHRFKYHMCWGLMDLNQLAELSQNSRWLSYNRMGLMSIRDRDYIDRTNRPIKEKIAAYVESESGQPFTGQVWLFTHPRFMGYGFNSVSFYFCFENEQLRCIVSEINNTPWGEKHLYFHDCQTQNNRSDQPSEHQYRFQFAKAFHISPFMSMELEYDWHFSLSAEELKISMSVDKDSVNMLRVILDTKITPLMDNEVKQLGFRRPFQPWKMSLGIYWQAFKLWLKKIPFYDHPKHETTEHNN